MSEKTGFGQSLEKKIVSAGKCFGCGACVVSCPFACLEYAEERPHLAKDCENCGLCSKICPQYETSQSQLEKFVFGREKRVNADFGIYRRLAVARAKNPQILEAGQDGGAVTALLQHALCEKIVDGAIVSGTQDRSFRPAPMLATTPEEILSSAGTRYSYSPNVLALTDAVRQTKKEIAFVGTPCQIRAVRMMQTHEVKLASCVKLLFGLMCSECFTYEGLMRKHVHESLGLRLEDIAKINIKGKMMITTRKGETKTIPLAEIRQFARENCRYCTDFSSELADISFGGLGLNGWTFVIVRTEKGKNLLDSAEKADRIEVRNTEEEENALDLLSRLSAKKKATPP